MDTSSMQTSSLMSTSNNILSSSLSTGIMENKLLQSSKSLSFKRQISDNQAEPCKRHGVGPVTGLSTSFQTGKNELSSNKLLQNFGSLSVNKCLSSSTLKTSTLSSAVMGLSTSSSLLSTKSATPAAKATSKSSGTALSLLKEEPTTEENLSVPSFPAYPELQVKEESLQSNSNRFRSDLEQKNNTLLLEAKKEKLLQFVCVAAGGLVAELKKGGSETRQLLDQMIEEIVDVDPEFILKLALYSRKDLNLRLISNLLLAIASSRPRTSFYLKKYFNATVLLPSDWIMIANLFLTVNKVLPTGSLPAALRRVMKEKFPEFDEYQLGKYNKSLKGPSMEGVETEEEREEIMRGRDYDLKRLVRLLHLSDPADLVLAILEKKYPEDSEKFRQSRLEGMFDPSRAGKRMKLKTPVTWETQISLRGNKAEVWQQLIDEKKLPYMATVRNIRNLLLAGISEVHVQKVCSYISNETAVTKSRMFPFQFFTAYDVLNEVKQIKEDGGDGGSQKRQGRKKNDSEGKEKWMIAKEKKRNAMIQGIKLKHVDSIKIALDKAVNISARKNIPPLRGTTLILCGYGNDMNRRFTEAKGVSQKGATVRDATALFSLMCSQACEDSRLVFFSANHLEVELPGRDILSNVEFVKGHTELNKKVGVLSSTRGCTAVLQEYLEKEKFVDNIIIFQGDEDNYHEAYEVVRLYRKYINKDLLFALVNICGRPSASSDCEETFSHQNDLNIRGFSDSVFKLIVNKGNGGQLEAVEKIDKKHNLIKLVSPLLHSQSDTVEISPSLEIPVWQQVRVFISSTFLDMEAERNILHHFVLPQLQRRAAQRYISVDFIDLRWGLAADQLRTKNEVELCLEQIKRCDLFIGILGERYGWVPGRNIMETISPDYSSVLDSCQGTSITEMEMRFGVLNTAESNRDRSFFYFRSPEVITELDAKFVSEDKDDIAKLKQLKTTIRHSGVEVMENYRATVRDGRITGLEEFGSRVLSNLCNALDKLYPSLSITESSKYEEELKRQRAFCNKVAAQFVSRSRLREAIQEEVRVTRSGVVSLTGAPGAGITSLLATLAASLNHTKGLLVIPFISLSEDQQDIRYLLKFIIHHLGGKVKQDENSVQSLSVVLQKSLEHFSLTNRRVVIVLDSLKEASDADVCWFPENIPDNCLFLVKSLQGSKMNSLLKKQKANKEILVKQLDVKERNEICREVLRRRGKSLEETAFNNQLLSLVGKRGAGSPGYLMLAIDQISKEARFDNLSDQISQLGSTLTEINNDILVDCETIFGFDFVKLVLIFLNQSLEGLSKTQINTVCSFYHHLLQKNLKQTNVEKLLVEFQTFKTTNGHSVSLMDISMCVERLEPCLQNTRDVLRILDHITPVVQERYIKKCQSSTLLEINAILAVLHLDNYSNDVVYPAGVLSMTHHLGVCGDVKLLKTTVCSPKFIQVKSSLGQGSQLAREYLGKSLRFKSGQEKFRREPLVQEYQTFVQNNLETIKHQPHLIAQVILNEPEDSVIKKSARCEETEMTRLRWDNGPQTVRDIHVAGQTVISNVRNPATFILPSDKIVLTGYSDGSILVSEVETFEDQFCLVGHSDAITGLGELGKSLVVSASSDGLLSSWDLERRIRLASVRAHERRLTSLAVRHPNILTASWDGTIKVWSKALVNISTINTNSPLNCLLLHPRKDSVISGGWDSNIRIWDLQTLKQKAVIRGHDSSVQSVRLSPDCRKIISGSLNGTVKVWDSSTGAEVASFTTRPGLSHLDIEGGEVILAHSDGHLTSWPLAVGRGLATTPAREMLCPLYRQLAPGEVPLLDPTSLTREVTALHDLPQLSLLIVGFGNGDLQRKEKDGSWRGWKVFQSKIELIGSEQDMDLFTEEAEVEERMTETEDSDSDCLSVTSDWNFPADMSLFDCSSLPRRRMTENVLTVWLVSGPQVVLSTFHGTDLVATFALGDIRTNVVDLQILNKEIILVFTQSGHVYVYNGSDCASVSHNILNPNKVFDTKHGVLTAVTFSEPESKMMVSVGSDGKARCWSYEIQGRTFSQKQHSESSAFTSKPVGVSLTKQRNKDILLVGFEDGTLALVQMTPDFDSFSSAVMVAGNGHGVRRMRRSGDCLLLVHTDGPVSLWSQSGSEICQYSQGYTAALLTQSGERKVVVLAKTDLQLICPTESECREKYSGHQGALTALATSPGGLLTGARDGKVKRWEKRRSGRGEVRDQIVAVLASPLLLSLTKSGKLSLWLRAGQRVELRETVELGGDSAENSGGESYSMMSATQLYSGEIILATVSQLCQIKVWELLVTPTSFQAVAKAELNLGRRILRLDTTVDRFDGKLLIIAATESMAQVLTCLEIQSFRMRSKGRIVLKTTLPVSTREHELETEGAREYLDFIKQEGPVRLFKSKYLFRVQAGPTVYLTALDDGRIEVSSSEVSQVASYQVHHQEVTEIKMTSQRELLTISMDGKMKVWRLDLITLTISQTGEFSGLGPGLTSLDIDGQDNLVVGDTAGNVLCLTVIHGRVERRQTPSPSTPSSAKPSKNVLRERLFPLVEALCPSNAGNITGMLLELDESEIHRLIESRAALSVKVLEASRALQEANSENPDSESDLETWCSEELLNMNYDM